MTDKTESAAVGEKCEDIERKLSQQNWETNNVKEDGGPISRPPMIIKLKTCRGESCCASCITVFTLR